MFGGSSRAHNSFLICTGNLSRSGQQLDGTNKLRWNILDWCWSGGQSPFISHYSLLIGACFVVFGRDAPMLCCVSCYDILCWAFWCLATQTILLSLECYLAVQRKMCKYLSRLIYVLLYNCIKTSMSYFLFSFISLDDNSLIRYGLELLFDSVISIESQLLQRIAQLL